jgi:hypothetical protein
MVPPGTIGVDVLLHDQNQLTGSYTGAVSPMPVKSLDPTTTGRPSGIWA